MVDGNGVSTNVGLLQVRTDDPQVAEFGTVCGINLANIFGCCLCSNMWLTVVCFCRQLLMSCVCNWVTTLVLSARPRVIATAATICAMALPLARRCFSCRIPWHVCHPGHGVACVFCSCVVGGFIPRASPYHHRHLVSQRERIRGFEFSTKHHVTFYYSVMQLAR